MKKKSFTTLTIATRARHLDHHTFEETADFGLDANELQVAIIIKNNVKILFGWIFNVVFQASSYLQVK
jgi:hypothetical protein